MDAPFDHDHGLLAGDEQVAMAVYHLRPQREVALLLRQEHVRVDLDARLRLSERGLVVEVDHVRVELDRLEAHWSKVLVVGRGNFLVEGHEADLKRLVLVDLRADPQTMIVYEIVKPVDVARVVLDQEDLRELGVGVDHHWLFQLDADKPMLHLRIALARLPRTFGSRVSWLNWFERARA